MLIGQRFRQFSVGFCFMKRKSKQQPEISGLNFAVELQIADFNYFCSFIKFFFRTPLTHGAYTEFLYHRTY